MSGYDGGHLLVGKQLILATGLKYFTDTVVFHFSVTMVGGGLKVEASQMQGGNKVIKAESEETSIGIESKS